MPAKETFLNQRIGSEQFEIIKTYDRSLAREAFADMDSAALDHLADSLALEQQYELSDIPSQLSRQGRSCLRTVPRESATTPYPLDGSQQHR